MKLAVQLSRKQNSIKLFISNKDKILSCLELSNNKLNLFINDNSENSKSSTCFTSDSLTVNSKKLNIKYKNIKINTKNKLKLAFNNKYFEINPEKIFCEYNNININSTKYNLSSKIINFVV